MEACHYETVETTADREETIPRKYLLRQILVSSGIWVSYFSAGLSLGSPTVIIPQLRHEANSSDAVSIEMVSWLASTFNYSGLVSSVILAILARLIGRKLTFLFVCITSVIGYIVFYCSITVTHILISEIIQGPLKASSITVSIMIITEYTSPRYRGVFLTVKSAMFLWGIWVANTIGTFLHWKNIGILAFVCSIYCLLTALWWPESPYWLVNKNRIKDCAASHRWLKGYNEDSEKELETLIQSLNITSSAPLKPLFFFNKIVKMFKCKSFYKPFQLCMLVMSLYHFSGKVACQMYAIDIIKRITGTESTAYNGMLILDGITVLGMYVGCGLSRYLKRRTLLLISSTIGITFLFFMSFYLYLIHFEIISENSIVSMLLLAGYSLSISVGPMIMSTTILGELIPLKYRSSSVLLLGCFANLIMGSILKISPFIFVKLGIRGLFLWFAVSESLLIILNYKFLPETKDKTILEIQEVLLGTKSNANINKLCNKDTIN